MPPSTALKPTTAQLSTNQAGPDRGLPPIGIVAQSVLAAIHAYKLLVSPWLSGCCRFAPSCANYMAESVRAYGATRGVWLGLRRLARCHPLGGHGFDPVPPA